MCGWNDSLRLFLLISVTSLDPLAGIKDSENFLKFERPFLSVKGVTIKDTAYFWQDELFSGLEFI